MKSIFLGKIQYLGATCLLLCGLNACTAGYEEMNTNPDKVTDGMLDMDNLRTGGSISAMQLDIIPCSDEGANAYQRAQNLVGDIFSGYMSGSDNWNSSSNNQTYNLRFGGWSDVLFSIAYQNVMPQWKKIATEEVKAEEPVTYAIGQVLKIAAMHRVTDAYGPIPYFKFGESLMVPYDSQEKVYESFFNELTEASQILEQYATENPSARPLKNYDLVYEGDVSKWAKFANTLMLRLAMRVVYVKPDWAQKYAEQAVVKSKLGVMTSNADNALLHSYNGITVYHPLNVVWDMYKDARMGASMESYLKGYKDARISKYFSQATTPAGDYHGMRNGIIVDNIEGYRALSCPNVQKTDPVLWMCAAEAYFLRAEGALRQWNMNGDAKDLYEQGVQTSFEQHSAALGDYLTDDTAKPAKFEDKVGNNSTEPRSTITPVYKTEEGFEANLERIITQKWLAMFPEGMEAWSEFRRTGYPKIFPVVKNYSGGTIDTEKQIRRLPFPQTEYDNNNENVKNAISLLNGADHGGTPLWWDKK